MKPHFLGLGWCRLHPLALLLILGLLVAIDGELHAQNFWQQAGTPSLTPGNITALLADSTGAIYAGTLDGIYKSTDDGTTWVSSGLFPFGVFSIKKYHGLLFASANDLGVYRSSNNGANWVAINSGLVSLTAGELAMDRSGAIYAPTWDGLFKSTNDGNVWQPTTLQEPNLQTAAVDASENIYAGALDGGVFESTDNGQTWSLVFDDPGREIVALHGSPASSYVYFSSNFNGGGVFRSTNRGSTWQQFLPGLTTVDFAENSAGHIFLSTFSYVYRSTDSGGSWQQLSSGLTSSDVRGITVNAIGRVFVGTHSGDVFKSVLPTTSVGLDDGRLPLRFDLAQNYPNPFNPSTIIRFQIPQSGPVSLKVFDVLGREVAKVVDEDLSAGRYERSFVASGLSSGVYYYRLQTGGVVQTRSLMVLK